MVDPLFSGKNPNSLENNVERTDPIEIYHVLMLAYPAYTVERIETELSWRLVKCLLNQWDKKPPVNIRIERIEKMIEAKFGIKLTSSKTSEKQMMSELQGMGWL